MPNRIPKTYHDQAKWKHEQSHLYGQLRTISSKALVEVGANDACILHHLWHLQNYTPKGGHIPTTEDGSRASFNTYDQIHEYLPFIPVRTIKSRIKALSKMEGFTKFKYAAKRANHFHITEELADRLDLSLKGRNLFFHVREAEMYGVLPAILVARTSFANASFNNPAKSPTRVDLVREYKRYAKDKRKVSRAVASLTSRCGNFGDTLLTFDDEQGHVICQWSRQLHGENSSSHAIADATLALSQSQNCTVTTPSLPTQLPNLPNRFLIKTSQSDHCEPCVKQPLPLNTLNNGSKIISKEASHATHFLLPPTATLIDHRWIAFDCRTPYSAPPEMEAADSRFNGQNAPLTRFNAQPRTVTDVTSVHSQTSSTSSVSMVTAQPIPCSPTESRQSISGIDVRTHFGFGSTSHNSSESTWCPPTFKDGKRLDESALWIRFNEVVTNGGFIPDFDDESYFLRELRGNQELGARELETIYSRLYHSESKRMQTIDGKFNPYFYSTRVGTAKQIIGNFYLILEDEYRVCAEELNRTRCSKNKLRADTPSHVRAYITRKSIAAGRYTTPP